MAFTAHGCADGDIELLRTLHGKLYAPTHSDGNNVAWDELPDAPDHGRPRAAHRERRATRTASVATSSGMTPRFPGLCGQANRTSWRIAVWSSMSMPTDQRRRPAPVPVRDLLGGELCVQPFGVAGGRECRRAGSGGAAQDQRVRQALPPAGPPAISSVSVAWTNTSVLRNPVGLIGAVD
jgi:hypothetical protein